VLISPATYYKTQVLLDKLNFENFSFAGMYSGMKERKIWRVGEYGLRRRNKNRERVGGGRGRSGRGGAEGCR